MPRGRPTAQLPMATAAARDRTIRNGTNGNGVAVAKKPAAGRQLARLAAASDPQAAMVARHEQFASFQADAPSCDRCGAITARAGNCYLCYNCGNSMGCS